MKHAKEVTKKLCKLTKLSKETQSIITEHLTSTKLTFKVDKLHNPCLTTFYSLRKIPDLLFILRTAIKTNDRIIIHPSTKVLDNINYGFKYTVLDSPGHLDSSENAPLKTTLIENENSNYSLIFGTDKPSVLEGFLSLINLVCTTKINNLILSLGHIDPKLRINKTRFVGYNLSSIMIDILTVIKRLKYIDLNKLLASILKELNLEHKVIVYNQPHKVDLNLINNKLNLDLVKPLTEFKGERERASYLIDRYNSRTQERDFIKIPSYSMVLTKSGAKVIDKLEGKNFNIWTGTEWVYATCKCLKKSRFEIYYLELQYGHSMELYEGDHILVARGLINVNKLQVGDRLIRNNLPKIDSNDILEQCPVTITNIIKYEAPKNVYLYGIKSNSKDSNTRYITPQGVAIIPDLICKSSISTNELDYRTNNHDVIIAEQTIAKYTRLLKVDVNCNLCKTIDCLVSSIKTATIISLVCFKNNALESSNEDIKYSLSINPIINVCLTNLEYFFYKLFGSDWLIWFKHGRLLSNKMLFIQLPKFIDKLDKYHYLLTELNIEGSIDVETTIDGISVSGQLDKVYRYLEALLLVYLKENILTTCSEFCLRNGLNTPIRYTSIEVDKRFSDRYTYRANLDFIKVLNTYYVTHVSKYKVPLTPAVEDEALRYIRDSKCFDYIEITNS